MSSTASPPDTRTRILVATLDLLSSGDGNAVRMSDIAKRAKVSRQALYMHFKTRAELLEQATYYHDHVLNSDARLAASRAAPTGAERLEAFVTAWADYIPKIYGPARAFLDMERHDPEARAAWAKRMEDMREGVEAAIRALERDGDLGLGPSPDTATDLL
ncbi:MAG: TetR/AcrR family transcriptional regulator [Paracoccaceae bacterium]